MEHNYTKVCPKCNSNEIKSGRQQGYEVVTGGGIFKTSNVVYYACGKCGYVVDQFLDKPQNLKDVKPRMTL